MNLQAGVILKGRYEILGELGEGGFGSIFKAQDIALNRLVALKLLKSDTLDAEQLVERFQRESRLLAQLVHRNILTVYSYELADDYTPVLVMEYLDGASLAEIIRKRAAGLDYESCKNVFMQICQGLAWAHKQEIAHRDLGAQNIMICSSETGNATVKILDFGLARITQSSGADTRSKGNTITQTGALIGNPAYLSPEGCRGQKMDQLSDIYSLGCILYEMLSGKKPFNSWNPMELIVQHQTEYPAAPEINWENKEAASLYKDITLLCMQKDRERRPQSVEQIVEMLDETREFEALLKKAVLWGQSSSARQNFSLAAVFCALLVAGFASVLLFMNRPISEKRKTTNIYKSSNSEEQKWKERIAQLKRHSRNNTILIEPLDQLALVYKQEGKLDLAVETTEEERRLIKNDPEHELYSVLRVVARLLELRISQKKYAEAEKLCREGVEIERLRRGTITNDYAGWTFHLANCLSYQGKYKEAEDEFKRGLEVYAHNIEINPPAYVAALLQTARFYTNSKQNNKAIALYDRAINVILKTKPVEELEKQRLPQIQLELARLKILAGQKQEANYLLKAAVLSARDSGDSSLLSLVSSSAENFRTGKNLDKPASDFR